ncbi:MAG: N-acetylneuraminate synthase [Promethearchaeota archaeon]
MNEILINGKKIGKKSPIFLIAEAGINHNGDILLAKKLIDIAANAEVDAIKFQTFKTENVFLSSTPKVEYQRISEEDSETFNEMAKKFEFSRETFKELKNYCDQKNIIFLSTPYDKTSVDWLKELKVTAYKISSGDMNNFPLLKYICSKKKPILLSTGMATLEEVKETIQFLESNNANNIVIFQCTTNYPSNYEELNLNVINTYLKEFPNYIIGFSDHSLGIEASIGAAAKGAKIIEKHFTVDKNLEGPDHSASLNPEELIQWVKGIRIIEKALGEYKKEPSKVEKDISKIVRRSIISLVDLKKGEYIKEKHIGAKRPATGISPNFFYRIIGKKVKRDINKDSIINWDDLE